MTERQILKSLTPKSVFLSLKLWFFLRSLLFTPHLHQQLSLHSEHCDVHASLFPTVTFRRVSHANLTLWRRFLEMWYMKRVDPGDEEEAFPSDGDSC